MIGGIPVLYRMLTEKFAKIFYNSDGSIADGTYSTAYQKEHHLGKYAQKDSKKESKKKTKKETSADKESLLTKILMAPLRFLWWLVKKILKLTLNIVTLGLISNYLNGDD